MALSREQADEVLAPEDDDLDPTRTPGSVPVPAQPDPGEEATWIAPSAMEAADPLLAVAMAVAQETAAEDSAGAESREVFAEEIEMGMGPDLERDPLLAPAAEPEAAP